jgi:hypothetical protein
LGASRIQNRQALPHELGRNCIVLRLDGLPCSSIIQDGIFDIEQTNLQTAHGMKLLKGEETDSLDDIWILRDALRIDIERTTKGNPPYTKIHMGSLSTKPVIVVTCIDREVLRADLIGSQRRTPFRQLTVVKALTGLTDSGLSRETPGGNSPRFPTMAHIESGFLTNPKRIVIAAMFEIHDCNRRRLHKDDPLLTCQQENLDDWLESHYLPQILPQKKRPICSEIATRIRERMKSQSESEIRKELQRLFGLKIGMDLFSEVNVRPKTCNGKKRKHPNSLQTYLDSRFLFR